MWLRHVFRNFDTFVVSRWLESERGSIIMEYLVTGAVAALMVGALIALFSANGDGLKALAAVFEQLYMDMIDRYIAVDQYRGDVGGFGWP